MIVQLKQKKRNLKATKQILSKLPRISKESKTKRIWDSNNIDNRLNRANQSYPLKKPNLKINLIYQESLGLTNQNF